MTYTFIQSYRSPQNGVIGSLHNCLKYLKIYLNILKILLCVVKYDIYEVPNKKFQVFIPKE